MENHELRDNYQDLCEIIQAVENGQADLARKLARNHVLRFSRNMEMRAEGVTNGEGRGMRGEGRGMRGEGRGRIEEY